MSQFGPQEIAYMIQRSLHLDNNADLTSKVVMRSEFGRRPHNLHGR
jgi:hypothetical protein